MCHIQTSLLVILIIIILLNCHHPGLSYRLMVEVLWVIWWWVKVLCLHISNSKIQQILFGNNNKPTIIVFRLVHILLLVIQILNKVSKIEFQQIGHLWKIQDMTLDNTHPQHMLITHNNVINQPKLFNQYSCTNNLFNK